MVRTGCREMEWNRSKYIVSTDSEFRNHTFLLFITFLLMLLCHPLLPARHVFKIFSIFFHPSICPSFLTTLPLLFFRIFSFPFSSVFWDLLKLFLFFYFYFFYFIFIFYFFIFFKYSVLDVDHNIFVGKSDGKLQTVFQFYCFSLLWLDFAKIFHTFIIFRFYNFLAFFYLFNTILFHSHKNFIFLILFNIWI